MSTGFSKWTENDNSNLNIKAVRFGFKKPILETELNELQDLTFLSSVNANRTCNRPHTYASNLGSSLKWEYVTGEDTLTANLMLTAKTTDDIIRMSYSGGIDYYIQPAYVGKYILASVVLPVGSSVPDGTCITLVSKATLKTVSPDPSDSDYDSRVTYAIDSRYPSLVSTKRVIVDSGFDGEYTEAIDSSYSEVCESLNNTGIKSLNSSEEACIILGSWKWDVRGIGWTSTYEIYDVNSKYQMISDGVETWGTYSMTPTTGGSSYYFYMDFPVKSPLYGLYTLVDKNTGTPVGNLVPVNQPYVVPSGNYIVALYDLMSRLDSDKNWGSGTFEGMSWEDLLNQDWFNCEITDFDLSFPTLKLELNEVSKMSYGGSVGSLTILNKL